MCTPQVRVSWAEKSFSVTRYSCRRSNSWSTEPVMYANRFFQPISLSTSALSVYIDREYARYEGGRQAEEPAMVGSSLLVKRCVRISQGYSANTMRATFIPAAWDHGASLEDVQRAAGVSFRSARLTCDLRSAQPDVRNRVHRAASLRAWSPPCADAWCGNASKQSL